MLRLTTIRKSARLATQLAAACSLAWCAPVFAQVPNIHYFHNSNMAPGVVGRQQLLRGPTMAGYFQAVEVLVPDGVHVSLALDGHFDEPRPGPVLAGMQIGYVYSLKVTRIPFHEGAEVYPSIELVNRLNPPPGAKQRFPVPIELTQEELEMALEGRFVTRVIYLEDPDNAIPQRDDPQHQRYVEVGPREDPLYVADRLGRPMAILRMGSRIPDEHQIAGGMGAPPIELYESNPPAEVLDLQRAAPAVDRHEKDFPRIPLGPLPHSRRPANFAPYTR